MTRRRELEDQLRLFRELMDIMSAMKNLALTELRKLGRYQQTQARVVGTIEAAAVDFSSHFTPRVPLDEPPRPWLVLVGSERGFCGGFNEMLLQGLQRYLADRPGQEPRLIVVGRRLHHKLAGDARVAAEVNGPSVVDEVDEVLQQMVTTLGELQPAGEPFFLLGLTVLHHDPDGEHVRDGIADFRPIAPFLPRPPRYGARPHLHLPPRTFLAELIDQYFFALLHSAFYTSLTAENQWRLRQTEGALHRMESRLQQWQQQVNLLRQEEVTAEIIEIMQSVEAIQRPPGPET